jgi:hypothetical protein
VEYQLPGVLQIPVNEKQGPDLRARPALHPAARPRPRDGRRDPRPETAQIAVQAALTGHLVFTTVHANNVFDVLGRFTHMQVDPYSFAAALNGIVAQRLVRLNCPHCSAPTTPDGATCATSAIDRPKPPLQRFMHGKGCGQCRSTGYLKGRTAIAEIMVLTDELREMIVAREPIRALKEAARRGGTRFLRDAAVELVRAGTDQPGGDQPCHLSWRKRDASVVLSNHFVRYALAAVVGPGHRRRGTAGHGAHQFRAAFRRRGQAAGRCASVTTPTAGRALASAVDTALPEALVQMPARRRGPEVRARSSPT